jgi:hypothetical protein
MPVGNRIRDPAGQDVTGDRRGGDQLSRISVPPPRFEVEGRHGSPPGRRGGDGGSDGVPPSVLSSRSRFCFGNRPVRASRRCARACRSRTRRRSLRRVRVWLLPVMAGAYGVCAVRRGLLGPSWRRDAVCTTAASCRSRDRLPRRCDRLPRPIVCSGRRSADLSLRRFRRRVRSRSAGGIANRRGVVRFGLSPARRSSCAHLWKRVERQAVVVAEHGCAEHPYRDRAVARFDACVMTR